MVNVAYSKYLGKCPEYQPLLYNEEARAETVVITQLSNYINCPELEEVMMSCSVSPG